MLNQQYRRVFPEEEDSIVRIFKAIVMHFDLYFQAQLPLPHNRAIRQAAGYIRSVAKRFIQQKKERREKEEDRAVDILSVALADGVFSGEGLADQMMTFLAAGHETVANALQWAACALSRYPDIQSRLRQEVRSNLPAIPGKNVFLVSPRAEVIVQLPHLNAFCSEVFGLASPLVHISTGGHRYNRTWSFRS